MPGSCAKRAIIRYSSRNMSFLFPVDKMSHERTFLVFKMHLGTTCTLHVEEVQTTGQTRLNEPKHIDLFMYHVYIRE